MDRADHGWLAHRGRHFESVLEVQITPREARDVPHAAHERKKRLEVEAIGIEGVHPGDRGELETRLAGVHGERATPPRRIESGQRFSRSRGQTDHAHPVARDVDTEARPGSRVRRGHRNGEDEPANQNRRTETGTRSRRPPGRRRSTAMWVSPRLSICRTPTPERGSWRTPAT